MASIYKILQNVVLDGTHFEQGLVVDLTNLEEEVIASMVKRGIISTSDDDTSSEVSADPAPLGTQSRPTNLPDQPAQVTDRVTSEMVAEEASQQPTQEQIDQDLEDTAASTKQPQATPEA